MNADIRIENHGSIVLIRPVSDAGQEWLDNNIGDDAQMFGTAIAAEPRYVQAIIEGAECDGLTVA